MKEKAGLRENLSREEEREEIRDLMELLLTERGAS